MSVDYETKLLESVLYYNREITRLSKLNQQAKNENSPDTAELKNEITIEIGKCFGVPKHYVKANPSSGLCITALKMMGSGDPTSKNPVDELEELFSSLSDDIKNGEGGIKYKEWLDALKSKNG